MRRHRSLLSRSLARLQLRAPTCTAATPYGEPQSGTEFEAYSNYTITWSAPCLDAKAIDIYLYDAGGATAPLHAWTGVQASSGELQTVFNANWWNATADSTTSLYLQFVDSGDPAWASSYSVGPTFSVAWDGTVPADLTPTGPTWNTTVEAQPNPDADNGGVTGGKLVAAILVPLLAVLALGAGYVIWNRRKSKSATKRWSKVVEKRMSQISQAGSEWRPPAPRPGSLAASHVSAYRQSMGSASFVADQSFGNENRNSRVSFATPQTSPSKNKQNFPRVGQPLRSTPISRHQHQTSVSSSLRNQFRASTMSFGEADLAGAVSYIQGNPNNFARQSFAGSQYSGGMHSNNASIGSHLMLSNLTPQRDLHHNQHTRAPSEMSLKMPRLQRSSLSPDQALLAYAEAKDKQQDLAVTSVNNKQRPTSPSDRQEALARPMSAYLTGESQQAFGTAV